MKKLYTILGVIMLIVGGAMTIYYTMKWSFCLVDLTSKIVKKIREVRAKCTE